MKSAHALAVLLLASAGAAAQTPSEEFDQRIPSGRVKPTLQLGGAADKSPVRVIEIGRRAPRSAPGDSDGETEAEYRQRRINEADAWQSRTHVRPDPPPPSRCEGPTCVRR